MKKSLSFILLLSFVLLTLILAHLSQRHKAPLGKISTKLSTKYIWVKGIQLKGPALI